MLGPRSLSSYFLTSFNYYNARIMRGLPMESILVVGARGCAMRGLPVEAIPVVGGRRGCAMRGFRVGEIPVVRARGSAMRGLPWKRLLQ